MRSTRYSSTLDMNPSTYRRPGAFSPRPPISPVPSQGRAQSTDPSESDSSTASQVIAPSLRKHSMHPQQSQPSRPLLFQAPSSSNASSVSVNNFSRPSISHASSDQPLRKNSPFRPDLQKHRRQHSQGFFEPSLPTATSSEQAMMTNLTASQIAAQAAMQHQASNQHVRKRSQTVPSPQIPPETAGGRRKPPPIQATTDATRKLSGGPSPNQQQYHNGLVGGHTAAASAANAAFPRSAQLSPGLTSFEAPTDKGHKLKTERSKRKLFSKPKQLGISSTKDSDPKDRPLPSPNKMGLSGPSGLSKIVNPSMTSLAESIAPSASSIYASNNASTSTLVPADRQATHEKEKAHKHNFLLRQKNKFKERIDDHVLPLSSVSSNSKPLDPSAPYSFAPASPAPTTTSFTKSVSGLDLRHGGRALREKKKEEKAFAAQPSVDKRSEVERTDWALSSSYGSPAPHSFLGAVASSGASVFGASSTAHAGDLSAAQNGLQGFGISNMSPEEAWDFLKAKLLIIFEGEELRMPVEDLNRLVSEHIQRCISKRVPTIITEDLRELLQTGFRSLDQTLRGIPDRGLVPYLVEMWRFVFGTILPYMQAVFLPLDLEFKGHGVMTPQEAAEFWGANPDATDNAFGNEFDVRRIVLISYRDNIILPRHDSLKAIFSRLSLDSVNATVSLVNSSPDVGATGRPGTAASLDPGLASFNSQSSTLLEEAASGRSRATSNLSAPDLPPFTPPRVPRQPPQDSSQVTEMVGRMLQCVSVLASVQSGDEDEAQARMEGLARELKLNWLGRGRTGRNRKGFIGTRIPAVRHGSSQGKTEQVESSRRESML